MFWMMRMLSMFPHLALLSGLVQACRYLSLPIKPLKCILSSLQKFQKKRLPAKIIALVREQGNKQQAASNKRASHDEGNKQQAASNKRASHDEGNKQQAAGNKRASHEYGSRQQATSGQATMRAASNRQQATNRNCLNQFRQILLVACLPIAPFALSLLGLPACCLLPAAPFALFLLGLPACCLLLAACCPLSPFLFLACLPVACCLLPAALLPCCLLLAACCLVSCCLVFANPYFLLYIFYKIAINRE
jgi:hypothetical protein